MIPRAAGTSNEHRNDEAGYHDPVATGILDTIGVAGVLCHPPEQWRVAQPYEDELQSVEDEERNAKDEGSQDIQEGLVGFLVHHGSSFQGWATGSCDAHRSLIIRILYHVAHGLYTITEK